MKFFPLFGCILLWTTWFNNSSICIAKEQLFYLWMFIEWNKSSLRKFMDVHSLFIRWIVMWKKYSKQITELNIISDSPSSQYRNKIMIYFLKYYATSRKTILRWLFLESGPGKDIADSIGSVIKRLFDNTIRLNSDESFKAAEDLMNKIMNSINIRLYIYNKCGNLGFKSECHLYFKK